MNSQITLLLKKVDKSFVMQFKKSNIKEKEMFHNEIALKLGYAI